ncbi:MAG: ABC transporter permease [Gammaproteobacteria bacterium]
MSVLNESAAKPGWWRQSGVQPQLLFGTALIALLLAMVIAPQLFSSQSPTAIDLAQALQPPSQAHWFGTDDVGRDIYTRVIYGARITLGVVAGSLLIAAFVGGWLGLLAGFYGRTVDMLSGRVIDVVLSFPPIILGVIITGILGPGLQNLVLALSLVYLPVFFRIARSGAISEANKTYVEAARALGMSRRRILARHIARNVLPLLLLQYMILFPLALQIEAALGFLGLGIQPPTPDWGAILEQSKDFVLFAPWMSLFPGLFILLSAFGVMLAGRGLQQRLGLD